MNRKIEKYFPQFCAHGVPINDPCDKCNAQRAARHIVDGTEPRLIPNIRSDEQRLNEAPAMYRMAMIAMDGVAASGIVNDLADWVGIMWAEARERQLGTDYVNQHPVMRIILEKLCQLNRITIGNDLANPLSDALRICARRAAGLPDEPGPDEIPPEDRQPEAATDKVAINQKPCPSCHEQIFFNGDRAFNLDKTPHSCFGVDRSD